LFMSDLVKTDKDLIKELNDSDFCLRDNLYLVLPSGLNCLEEMLKDRFEKETDFPFQFFISDVFARFKQDNGLVNTEGMKKEHGIKEE